MFNESWIQAYFVGCLIAHVINLLMFLRGVFRTCTLGVPLATMSSYNQFLLGGNRLTFPILLILLTVFWPVVLLIFASRVLWKHGMYRACLWIWASKEERAAAALGTLAVRKEKGRTERCTK